MDSDKLLVMNNGKVVESGMPQELYLQQDGYFRAMVEQDEEREVLARLMLRSD